MPKAYSYIRMSTPEQINGDSLRRQIAAADAYALRKGLEIEQRFDDIGVSGFRGRNAQIGALKNFLELVESGKIAKGSYLIVESIDRLSRDKVSNALALLTSIIHAGIVVVALSENKEFSTKNVDQDSFSLMYALLSMVRAHDESRRKSSMLGAAWSEKRSAARNIGKPLTKLAPAWLKMKSDRSGYEIISERAELVRRIFDEIILGRGAGSIAKDLTVNGPKPWGRSSVWNESYIKKIANSSAVFGDFQPHVYKEDDLGNRKRIPDGEPIPGYYPAILDKDTYLRAKIAMRQRAISGRGRKGEAFRNPLTGLLKCRCGSGIQFIDKGKPPKGGTYLRCGQAVRKGNCTCPAFRFEVVLQIVIGCVKQLDVRRFLNNHESRGQSEEFANKLQSLRSERELAKEKALRLTNAIGDGAIDMPDIVINTIRAQEQRIIAIDSEIKSLEILQNDLITDGYEQRKLNVQNLFDQLSIESNEEGHAALRMQINSELRSILKFVRIEPDAGLLPDGVSSRHLELDGIPWEKLSSRYRNLEDHLHFKFRIVYRNGVVDQVEPLSGRIQSLEFSRKQEDLILKKSI